MLLGALNKDKTLHRVEQEPTVEFPLAFVNLLYSERKPKCCYEAYSMHLF